MTIVVVAEKPSVARDIARVLGARKKVQGFLEGNGYVVTPLVERPAADGPAAVEAQDGALHPEAVSGG
jgi:hypothetical protein